MTPRRRSLLVSRVHTLKRDQTPRCGWDNLPDPERPHLLPELAYCGACVLIDLYQERLDPAHDPYPWTLIGPGGCRPPDLMPWEARALLSAERWTFTLTDLAPWVVDDHHWWFSEIADPSLPAS